MIRVTSKNFAIELSDGETKVIDLYVGNNWMHHHNRRPSYADICPLSDLSSKRDRQIIKMSDAHAKTLNTKSAKNASTLTSTRTQGSVPWCSTS